MNGIERIKQLAADIKDEALLEIINYLISREDMNDKYLNEEKSLKQMIEYIKGEAKKKAQNNMAIIKDDVVFGWAIHYFDETNESLGISKNVEINQKEQIQEKKSPETAENEQKEEKIEQNITKTSSKNKYQSEGQLTLF